MDTVKKIHFVLGENFRLRFIFIFILILIGTILETLSVALVLPALLLFANPTEFLSHPVINGNLDFVLSYSQYELIIIGMSVLILSYFLKSVFLFYLIWMQNIFSFKFQAFTAQRIFNKYLNQEYNFHLRRNSAELIRNITFEVQSLSNGVVLQGMTLLTEIFVLIGISILLLNIHLFGTLISITSLLVISSIYYLTIRGYILKWGKKRQLHDGYRLKHLQQGLNGIKEAKVLGREDYFKTQFEYHNENAADVSRLQNTFQQFPRISIEFLAVLGLFFLIYILILGNAEIPNIIATVGLFGAAAFRLLPSLNRIISALTAIRFGLPALDKVYFELSSVLVNSRPEDIQVSQISCEYENSYSNLIKLDNITYRHKTSKRVTVENITLSINKGEIIGLVGPSGSGKSTTIDILLGLLSPDKGEVKYKDKNIFKSLRDYQDNIGYVPQNIYLTDDTLKRNIAFGRVDENISSLKVEKAIGQAQLDEFVGQLPLKEDSLVGEQGLRISGGQRQRVGIARALYNDPTILILDEATSSLDEETENEIMKSIYNYRGIRTIIIVTHRLSTVKDCDRIYNFKDGKIKSYGNPNDIL